MLLIFLVVCVVLLYDFTFLVSCCNVRYDFRIKTMLGSSLSPVICMRAHVLFTLCVFACDIIVVFCFVSFVFVLRTQCCQFLWIVFPLLPHRRSLTFLYQVRSQDNEWSCDRGIHHVEFTSIPMIFVLDYEQFLLCGICCFSSFSELIQLGCVDEPMPGFPQT